MIFSVLKTLHIVGFVSWFAGLFYLGRMFVYYREAQDKSEPEKRILSDQLLIMQNRVYKIICNPAMIVTWICGIGMLHIYGTDWFVASNWMHIKLLLLILLSGFTGSCGKMIKTHERGESKYSSFQYRLMNEIPTLFLLTIVLLAVFKNSANAFYVFGAVLLLGFFLFLGTRMYKKSRETKGN